MTAPDSAGSPALFASLVSELLAAEEKRRESLEARGGSVITVSGTLVTLLLGLAALVTKETTFHVPPAARDRLSVAVFAFVAAALLAIATYVPQPARIVDPAGLARLLPTIWDRGGDFALKKTTATRLEQLATTKAANDRKALALLGAVIAQVAALLLVAWAVLEIL
ncbi:MAG TPA: hypothetical protein VH418_17855 [Solirubrobacteraceae bacterium]|jgi:hypothetical protein